MSMDKVIELYSNKYILAFSDYFLPKSDTKLNIPEDVVSFPKDLNYVIRTEVDNDSLMVVTPKGIIYGSKIIKEVPGNKNMVFEVLKTSNSSNILIRAPEKRYAVFDGLKIAKTEMESELDLKIKAESKLIASKKSSSIV